MGCGTSKALNVVSPVTNTQTSLPKGSKDSLPGKPQGPKNVDRNVVTQKGGQDTHWSHKPLKENTITNRLETTETKQEHIVRSNRVEVENQDIVAQTFNDLSAFPNKSKQQRIIPLKEDKANLISNEVRHSEDSNKIPCVSATPSDHDAMQTESSSSKLKVVLTETPHKTSSHNSKFSSPALIQEEAKVDVTDTPRETTTPISKLSSPTLIQEKTKVDVIQSPHVTATPSSCSSLPKLPVQSKDFTEDLTIKPIVTLAEIEQQDNITEEVSQVNQSSVTMETDRVDSKESQSSVTMEIQRGDSKESQSSVTMETDLGNGKEIVTIRIEVDDELEPELQDESVRVPGKECCTGHKSSLRILACELGACEVKSTSSYGRHFKTKSDCTVRSKLTAGFDSNVDRVCKSPSLRIEKHMNEELDVYPTMLAVSPTPSLSVVRSVIITSSLTELKEEEEEDENNTEQGEE